jgi:hypothetical protein
MRVRRSRVVTKEHAATRIVSRVVAKVLPGLLPRLKVRPAFAFGQHRRRGHIHSLDTDRSKCLSGALKKFGGQPLRVHGGPVVVCVSFTTGVPMPLMTSVGARATYALAVRLLTHCRPFVE